MKRVIPFADQSNFPTTHANSNGIEGVLGPGIPPSNPGGRRAPRPEQLSLLKNAAVRLKTFLRWPATAPITRRALAEAGFFFFGDADRVQCVFCLVLIGEWRYGDDAMIEHRRHSARCPFVLGLPVGNVTLATAASNANGNGRSLPTAFGPRSDDLEIRRSAKPEKGYNWKSVAVNQPGRNGIAFPMFMSYEERLKTYNTWPKLAQSPESMASSGFYYTGYGDKVKCFHCGGGIEGWEKDDDPMKEHARLYPTECPFIRENFKGDWMELKELNRKSEIVQKKGADFGSNGFTIPQSWEVSMDVVCKICLEKPMGIVLLPCAHLCACPSCCGAIKDCPVCRKPVRSYCRAQFALRTK